MNCNSCGHAETKVINSRLKRMFGEVRRLRVHRCSACDDKTETVEIPFAELEGLKKPEKTNVVVSGTLETEYMAQELKKCKADLELMYQEKQHWKGLALLNDR